MRREPIFLGYGKLPCVIARPASHNERWPIGWCQRNCILVTLTKTIHRKPSTTVCWLTSISLIRQSANGTAWNSFYFVSEGSADHLRCQQFSHKSVPCPAWKRLRCHRLSQGSRTFDYSNSQGKSWRVIQSRNGHHATILQRRIFNPHGALADIHSFIYLEHVPPIGNLGVGNLCGHVPIVVVVSSYDVPRYSHRSVRVDFFKRPLRKNGSVL